MFCKLLSLTLASGCVPSFGPGTAVATDSPCRAAEPARQQLQQQQWQQCSGVCVPAIAALIMQHPLKLVSLERLSHFDGLYLRLQTVASGDGRNVHMSTLCPFTFII